MQHQEKYTLQWNSYSDHLRKVLIEMMTSSEFADVTLVTDDKKADQGSSKHSQCLQSSFQEYSPN